MVDGVVIVCDDWERMLMILSRLEIVHDLCETTLLVTVDCDWSEITLEITWIIVGCDL